MLNQKEFSLVYETVLASPGMSDNVKIGLTLPRKQVLLITKIIEAGIAARGDGEKGGLLSMVDAQMITSVEELKQELLQKAGLREMNDMINSLLSKQ